MERVMRGIGSIVCRDDTLLGACYGLAEDFGFSPLYLRIGFALLLFWSPAASFGAYAALWTVVAITRIVAPGPAAAAAAPTTEAVEPAKGGGREPLPLAA